MTRDPWPHESPAREHALPYTDEDLRHAYEVCGLTQKQIRKKWHLCGTTLNREMQRIGVGGRERGTLPGDRHGRWLVLARATPDSLGRVRFYTRCDCGTERITAGSNLRHGNSKSCGCLARERSSARHSKPDGHAAITAILSNYRAAARKRGYCWELTRDEVNRLVRMPCHYCGDAAGNVKNCKVTGKSFAYNGIDRADNSKEYISTNVVPCCGTCNMAKRELSADSFIAWACRVAAKHGAGGAK